MAGEATLQNDMSQKEQEIILEVRECIDRAGNLLRSLGNPEFSRIGWLLEDTISYIDEAVVEQSPALKGKEVSSPANKIPAKHSAGKTTQVE